MTLTALHVNLVVLLHSFISVERVELEFLDIQLIQVRLFVACTSLWMIVHAGLR